MTAHSSSTGVRRRIACAMVVLVTGCHGSTSLTSALSKTLGPDGGTLSGPGGSSLMVPAGALSAPTVVTMRAISPGALPGVPAAGSVAVELGPEGQTFLAPVTIVLSFAPASLPPMTAASDLTVLTTPVGTMDHGYWLATRVVDETHISAQTTHFSWFWVADSRPFAAQTDAPSTACSIGGAACVDFEGEDGGFCSLCQCSDGTECPGSDPSRCCLCSDGEHCPENDARLCAFCDAAALPTVVPSVASQTLGPNCTFDGDLCAVCPGTAPVACAGGVCCPMDHPFCCGDGQSCGVTNDSCAEADAGAPPQDADGEADP